MSTDVEWDCADCGKNTFNEYYMVHDSIWAEAMPGDEQDKMLHIICLEKRLGRKLTAADFTGAPVNDPRQFPFKRTKILLNRLGAKQ